MDKKKWIPLLLAVLGTMVAYALCRFDLIIEANRSFLDTDQRLDYIATFSLINQFFQGQIPLWAPHDQMSLSYYYLGLGRDNFFNMVTAIICTPFVAFFDNPGVSFHACYSRVYFLVLLLVRTIGCFLLLKRFCNKNIILIPSVIYLSCFLSLTLDGDSAKHFYPLIIYLVLVTVERLRTSDLLMLLLLVSTQIGTSLVLFGFTVQSLHFFLLAAIGYHFFINKGKSLDQTSKFKMIPDGVRSYWAFGVACFLIVLPNIIMWLTTFQDLSYHDGATRTSHMFDLAFYLKAKSYFAPETFSQLINPTLLTTWPFIGYATVLMALYGALMTTDKRRFIFIVAVIGSCSVTASSDSFFGFPGHILNFFTNPLHFLVNQTSHQTARVITYFIFPLTLLGISSLLNPAQESLDPKISLKRKVFVFSAVLLALWGIASTTGSARIYAYAQTFLTFVFIIFMYVRPLKKKLWAAVMMVMFLIDIPFLLVYHPVLTSSSGHWNESTPSLGIKDYDHQNPKITPFRLFLTETPTTGLGGLLFNPCNMPGTYLRFTNMTKNFVAPSEEMPRHKSFNKHQMDPTMQQYLMSDPIVLFKAEEAVKASDKTFKEIVDRQEQRHIAMIEDEHHQLNLPDYDGHSTGNSAVPSETFSYLETALKPGDGVLTTENGLGYLSFKLPRNWPLFMSSTFLTNDANLIKLLVVDANGKTRELSPSMGKPIEPFTYDIKNYSDKLTVALPVGAFPSLKNFVLFRLQPNHINVWKYNSDQTGLTYKTNTDGWLVIHYPYDKRWQITVNGKIVPYYKTNKVFMSIPISQGVNRILIEYMPDSWLRILILLSRVLILVGTVFVIIYACSTFINREKDIN